MDRSSSMKRKHNKTVLCAFVSGSVFGAVLVIAMSLPM
ncbi:hypothetical protein C408_0171 [Vibrio diabolicus E0666]|uniref:Uncharacterized protein n=1 Tax=Vibrio alginolyticus (strain ATCC 17749 / DSM 2171 / NBRC 15630 / NCIMB 1903 / NCTC 12160 / XII-53) TaxID=1219076 RepID=A0A2I3BYL4_VIBAX|nr:hypothetical protein N646_0144 [Vibrio alginolyticus NBRC 15630 = ATCC 17749]EMD81513.1 hypothetical protein C408_0171 [Vibrio diabolicus E0666]